MNEEGGRQARGAETSLMQSACVGAAVIGALICCDVMHSLCLKLPTYKANIARLLSLNDSPSEGAYPRAAAPGNGKRAASGYPG
jgi:hypothetical protein